MDIVLGMLFLTLSNAKINFLEWELNWNLYTTIEALLTIKQVELVRKKQFANIALDPDNKIFIVYIDSLTSTNIHLSHKAQKALLIQDNAFIVVLSEYTYFANVFSFNLTVKLPEYTKVNNYPIYTEKGK